VFIDRPDILLEDDVLGRSGTDDLAEPPEAGWAPRGPPCIANIVAQEEGFEPAFGGLEVSQGMVAGVGKIANGFIFHGGDIHGCEITRAHQAGQLHGVPTVGFHPIARLFGNPRRGHNPAGLAFVCEIAREPVATRSRFRDTAERRSLGWEPMEDVRALPDLSDNGDRSSVDGCGLARAHLDRVRAKINALRAMEEVLQRISHDCTETTSCRLLELFSTSESPETFEGILLHRV
jgi:hypothetical protein